MGHPARDAGIVLTAEPFGALDHKHKGIPTMTDNPPSTIQKQALWAAALGMFLDGFDLSIIAIALLPLRTQWHLDPAATGSLMASALIGSLLGGLIGGALIDRFGRRALLLPNVMLYVLGALGSALSPNLAVLWISRFVIGLGVGMDYPLVATVIAEYSSAERRGNHFAWTNIAWYVGALISTLVGLVLLPLGASSWRLMLGAAMIPAVFLLWLRRNIPESPRWLMRRGKKDAAHTALAALHPDWSTQTLTSTCERFAGTVRRWPVLLQKPWRKRLWLSLMPWFCLDVVGLGIGLYFPVVLRLQGLAHNNVTAAGINAIFLLISLAGIAFILPRLDRWGRIPLQIAGFALMAIGLLVFAGGLLLRNVILIYGGTALYAFGTGIGPGVTVMALSVEIFPTELRASAGGLATAVSRLGAALSAMVFPYMEANWGLPSVLILMAMVSALGLWITRGYRFEPATKTLESMESHPS
jgi:putative MFS transporter